MDDLLMQKDLAEAERLYKKIRDNKEFIISLINDILDLATFIPMCVAEYGNQFEAYNPSELVDKVVEILYEYGFDIIEI